MRRGACYGHGSLSTALTRTSGCPGNNCESGSVSDTRAGWTAGGGLDWAITGNWIGRFEYLYFDLGNLSHLMTDPRPAFTSVFDASANLKGSLALASLIYKF
jgi:outer membrane immunogenic protein